MVNRVCSLPLSYLSVLTIITLTAFLPLAIGTELKRADITVSATNLDQQLVFALLTPMSGLVQSPYADPAAIENPLGRSVKSPAIAAVHAVIIKQVPALSAEQRIDALEVDAEKSAPRIELAPPESGDALSILNAAQSKPSPMPNNSAIAMSSL